MKNYYPGVFELYYGPMKSGKSKALIDRVHEFDKHLTPYYLIIKPDVDTRNSGLYSRCYDNKEKECLFTKADKPEKILNHIYQLENIGDIYDVIIMDELQFFGKGIDSVIEELIHNNKHVIGAGLDTDWRGNYFGEMGTLMAKARITHPLYGVCEYKGCHEPSVRTQKLTNGNPTPYSNLIIEIENSKDSIHYETRCLEHHIVPTRLK